MPLFFWGILTWFSHVFLCLNSREFTLVAWFCALLSFVGVIMENCELVFVGSHVNRVSCLHLWYPAIACILVCLQLHPMLLLPKASLLFTISQGLVDVFCLVKEVYRWTLNFSKAINLVKFSRTSQFIIGLNKYLEAVNNKFSVGMRFKMRFEGEDSPERRCANSNFSYWW